MRESTPKYVLVEKHIKEAIQTKQLTDQLPGERILAQQLGFSYMTIRKAIENLVSEGILYKVPTKGTFINNKNRKKATKTIGYFLDNSIHSGISSPYYSLMFHAIEKEATKQGYSVVYFSDANMSSLQNTLSKVDGVIATCFPRIENTILKIKQSTPIVLIDNSSVDKTIPSVTIDNFTPVIDSVNYICSLGHSHIGFMTGLEDSDVGKSRHAGFEHGLRLNNIHLDDKLVFRGNYSYEAGIEGADYFMSLPSLPSAIICANDSMAIGAMRKFSQEGLNIPQDISIIGFDDIEVSSQIVPALTTVSIPIKDIAMQAVSMLNTIINNQEPNNRHTILPAKLSIRQSCEKQVKVAA